MKIWKCPNGCAGKRGPARPRRNASVRYCLACSSKSDTLVERVCESAERERTERTEKRKAKHARNRKLAREGEAVRYTVEGVDLRELWSTMLRLPSVPKWMRDFRLIVRRTKSYPRSRVGVMYYRRREIQITVWDDRALVGCVRTMLHELAHHVSYARHGRIGRGHGDHFRGAFNDLCGDWRERRPDLVPGADTRATVATDPSEAVPPPMALQESSCNAMENAVG